MSAECQECGFDLNVNNDCLLCESEELVRINKIVKNFYYDMCEVRTKERNDVYKENDELRTQLKSFDISELIIREERENVLLSIIKNLTEGIHESLVLLHNNEALVLSEAEEILFGTLDEAKRLFNKIGDLK